MLLKKQGKRKMTLKEKLLIYFFKNMIDQNFDEWYSCDIDSDGFFIQDGLNTSKKLISNRTKVFMEYLNTFSKASGLDLNSDYDENTSMASDLLLKVLTEKDS
jgi:hypothetical protein